MKKGNEKYLQYKIFVVIIFGIIFTLSTIVKAEKLDSDIKNIQDVENIQKQAKETISEGVNLDEYISSIDEYVKKSGLDELDMTDIAENLIENSKVDYKNIVSKLISVFFKEFKLTITSIITIFIIILIIAVISALELEEKSDITKIAHIACFLVLATITIANFLDIINMFKNTVSTITTLMQVVSPFLMGVLLATGSISSTGLIQPILLFIASTVGFIINYIVIPFLSIAIALNVISSISDNLKFNKLSKLFTSSSLWIIGVVFTVFIGVLSLETSFSGSIDALTIKTTQAAVSNFVPVVGKFFSDSFETVVGAIKIISNAGGILGIIAVIAIAIVPILKLTCIVIAYSLLLAIIEPICNNEALIKYVSGFANTYKTILGILIGVSILFIISTGIVLNLIGQVVK